MFVALFLSIKDNDIVGFNIMSRVFDVFAGVFAHCPILTTPKGQLPDEDSEKWSQHRKVANSNSQL